MNKPTLKIADLLSLLTFALFAICVLIVLLTGVSIYKDLVFKGQESYQYRTVNQYITTRVRQAESVYIETFGDCTTLTGTETVDGDTYLTRVYCYDGSIRELSCTPDADLMPEDGEIILPAESIEFSLEGDLLTVKIGEEEIYLHVRVRKDADA